jgi:acyl-CoA synthetase (AMP-forming)/AMP-acid ligase II
LSVAAETPAAAAPGAEEPARWFPGFAAARRPEQVALIDATSSASRRYDELDELANRTARLLFDLGLRPGDHVCLWFDNDIDYPGLWWGAHYAGLHYTLISSRLTPEEVAYIVGDSGARVALLGERLHRLHGAALQGLLDTEVTLIADDAGPHGLRALLAGVDPEPLDGRVEGNAMLYSSGTTGRPKAVKRTQSGAPLGTAGTGVRLASLFGIDEGAVYLSPAPLYHAAPYTYVTATTALGGTAVMMEHFDAEAFLAAVERYRVSHVQMVPTMFVRLLALPEEVRSRYDLSSLRCVFHAAAPCPVPVKQEMIAWLGPIIHEYYSGTEGAGFTYCSPADWLAHPGSVGRPMFSELHVVGDDGDEVAPGEDGLIFFAGMSTFEYHNDPDKTRSAHHPSGWSTYGDVGHVDEDGFLYLTDRRADLVIVGGVNVYPQEAENLLISHPLVLDAAVFGVPHPEFGEEVKAVVELVPGVEPGPETEAALIDHCRAHLAGIKCPRSIDFRADLPREPNGKLLKRLLRDEYRAAAAEGSGR